MGTKQQLVIDSDDMLDGQDIERLTQALNLASRTYRDNAKTLEQFSQGESDSPLITRRAAAQQAAVFYSYAEATEELLDRVSSCNSVIFVSDDDD